MRRYSIEPGTRNMYMYVYIRICTFVICEKFIQEIWEKCIRYCYKNWIRYCRNWF